MDRVMWTPHKPMPVLTPRRREVVAESQPSLPMPVDPRFSGMLPRSVSASLRLLMLLGIISLPLSCQGTSGPAPQPFNAPFNRSHDEHGHGGPGHTHGNGKHATADTWEGYMALSDQLHHALEDKDGVLRAEGTLNQALHKRLFPEMKSLFLNSYGRSAPNQTREVALGEFTHPDWKNGGMDGGRGLRIAFRRTNADSSRTSAILFLDYNPTTQQFDWVNQKAGSKSPDVIRFLHETEPLGSDPQRGFMGLSYTGHFDAQNKLTGLTPTPYYTANAEPRDAYPVSTRVLPDELQPAHCIMCHGRAKQNQFFRIKFEQERVAPGVAHQKAMTEFDDYLEGRHVPAAQRQQVRQWLANPTQYWRQLMPKDFLNELARLD